MPTINDQTTLSKNDFMWRETTHWWMDLWWMSDLATKHQFIHCLLLLKQLPHFQLRKYLKEAPNSLDFTYKLKFTLFNVNHSFQSNKLLFPIQTQFCKPQMVIQTCTFSTSFIPIEDKKYQQFHHHVDLIQPPLLSIS